MINIQLGLSRPEENKLIKYILEELTSQIVSRLKAAHPVMLEKLRLYVRTEFYNSSDVLDIMKGDLQAELGLTSELAASAMNQIITVVLEEMKLIIDYVPLKNKITFRLKLVALPIGYQRLLETPGASYASINERRGTEIEIPWLDWLINGNGIVVGFIILKGSKYRQWSRSGKAIMHKKAGVNWLLKLPAGLETQPTNNFLTKLFTGIEKVLFEETERVVSA